MANITVVEFRTRFAEFQDTTRYPDPLIQMYIDDSANEVDFSLFGPRAAKAQAYWVAHYLALNTISTDSAAGGAAGDPLRRVTSESEGDTSVSYASPPITSPEEEFWYSTLYGQVWLSMRDYAVGLVTSTGAVVMPLPRRAGRGGPFGPR